jgi:hypothetical protein
MLPSTGSIAGGTMIRQFRADGKLLVVPAFKRPLVDAGVVICWTAKFVTHRSGRDRVGGVGPLPERSVRRINEPSLVLASDGPTGR